MDGGYGSASCCTIPGCATRSSVAYALAGRPSRSPAGCVARTLPARHPSPRLFRGRSSGRIVAPPALRPKTPARLPAAQAPAARICFQLGTSFRPKIIAHRKQSGHRGGTGPSRPMARRRPVERSGAVPAKAWAGRHHHHRPGHQPPPSRVKGRGKARPRRSWPGSPRL